ASVAEHLDLDVALRALRSRVELDANVARQAPPEPERAVARALHVEPSVADAVAAAGVVPVVAELRALEVVREAFGPDRGIALRRARREPHRDRHRESRTHGANHSIAPLRRERAEAASTS